MSAVDLHPGDSRVQQEIEAAILSRLEREHPDWERAEWKVIAADLKLSAVWRGIKPDAIWLVKKGNSVQVIVAERYMRIGASLPGHVQKRMFLNL